MKNKMIKILLMTAALLTGMTILTFNNTTDVKAAECFYYDYSDLIPVKVIKDGKEVIEYKPRAYTQEQMNANLQLLDNINKISEAQLQAQSAKGIADATLSQINNLQTAIAGKIQEVAVNPTLQPQLDELNAQLNALQNQFNAQMADYNAKQATFVTLSTTLPTAGYNPRMCNALYGQNQKK